MTVKTVVPRSRRESNLGLPDVQRYILVGESRTHQWVVKDSRARFGAVFRAPDVALRFARREASTLGCRVVVDGGRIELDCLAPEAPNAIRSRRSLR
jgi:hypothetical protein